MNANLRHAPNPFRYHASGRSIVGNRRVARNKFLAADRHIADRHIADRRVGGSRRIFCKQVQADRRSGVKRTDKPRKRLVARAHFSRAQSDFPAGDRRGRVVAVTAQNGFHKRMPSVRR